MLETEGGLGHCKDEGMLADIKVQITIMGGREKNFDWNWEQLDIKWSKNSASLKMTGIGINKQTKQNKSMNQALKFILYVRE